MINFLHEKLDMYSEDGIFDTHKNIPLYVSTNLNTKFQIREYQKEAYARFSYYLNDYRSKELPIHLLFNMATGSGKTFVMASLIIELYEKGYRNFLFFVNSTNIIEKTKENFLNSNSSKYLFNEKIVFNGKQVKIKPVSNFSTSDTEYIQIKFTTIQGLHSDLNTIKENGLSYEDFEENKIVILSDEAHHISATTKKGKLNKTEAEEKTSWEQTVMNILNSHKENMLLEFTATLDFGDQNIAEKYQNKVIYKYDLKEFRLDKYSKEVDILKADMSQENRTLQALILSQYRLKIAEKNRIYCKPVILFKAQKTKAQSEENLENFNKLIKKLESKDIDYIKQNSQTDIIQKAFQFFEENNIKSENLVKELQEDFASENCISANDDSEAGKNQMLLNTLEDKNNRIRAVFAVQKLNEGWDVLNLFDIVRLYEGRDGDWKKDGKYTAGKTTMSEAQLIGRGARYFPFTTDRALGDNKYQRKFDNKDEEELKILETFYYHTSFDSKYISEITEALIKTGMYSEKEKKSFTLKLKDNFKKSSFYSEGGIYVNQRKKKDTSNVGSLAEVGLKKENFEYSLYTGDSGEIQVFEDSKKQSNTSLEVKVFEISDIDTRIITKAIQRNDFYKFDNLQSYMGDLKSITEFISSSKYLSNKKIHIYSSQEKLENLSLEDYLEIVSALLRTLETEIKSQEVEYEGTKEFKFVQIQEVFKDKTIFTEKESIYEKDKDWFVFENIIATSEEESFLKLFEAKINLLEKLYEDIYLIRSERHFAIFSFEKGERFEPDFVLFMKEKKTQKPCTYQVFIEPKGSQFKDSEGKYDFSKESWKNNFLSQIEDTSEILEMNLGNYRLIGLPLYNSDLESEFEETFDNKLLK